MTENACDWLKHVTFLIWLINSNISDVVLMVKYECVSCWDVRFECYVRAVLKRSACWDNFGEGVCRISERVREVYATSEIVCKVHTASSETV
jgi:hypothetical protein